MELIAIDSTEVLIAKINTAHAEAQAYASKAVERALEAGDLLLLAKSQVAHGQWLPWLQKNCPAISERTAQNYMRVAKELPIEKRNAADLTMREALRLVASEPEEPESKLQPVNDFVLPWLRSGDPIQLATSMRLWPDMRFSAIAYMDTAGMGVKEIAKTLNIYEEEIEPFVNTTIPYMDFSGIKFDANPVIDYANNTVSIIKSKAYDTASMYSERLSDNDLTKELKTIHKLHKRNRERIPFNPFDELKVEKLMGQSLGRCALGLEHYDSRGFLALHRTAMLIICVCDNALFDTEYGVRDIFLNGFTDKERINMIPTNEARAYLNKVDAIVDSLSIPPKQLGTATLEELKAERKRIWDNEVAIFCGDSSKLRLAA